MPDTAPVAIGDSLPKLAQAQSHAEAGNLVEAGALVLDVLDERPGNPDAMKILGYLYFLNGNGEDGIIEFERHLDISGGDPDLCRIFGTYLVHWKLEHVIQTIKDCAYNLNSINWRAHLIFSGILEVIRESESSVLHFEFGSFVRAAYLGYDPEPETSPPIERAYQSDMPERPICLLNTLGNQRYLKIAFGLHSKNQDVVLLTTSGFPVPPEHEKYFSRIVRFTTPVDLWKAMKEIDPQIFHVFSSTYQNHLGIFSAMLFAPEKCVTDFYDVIHPTNAPQIFDGEGESQSLAQESVKAQRFIYDHAPGICCRVLYPKITKSRLPGKRQTRIFLPDLTWGKKPKNVQKLSADDGELHVVHGGSFQSEANYGVEFCGLRWLAERADEFRVHFHLYVNWNGDQDMSEYIALAKNSRYFHMHDPVSADQWINELPIYDVGQLIIHTRDVNAMKTYPGLLDMSGAWAGKFSDYLDGNLLTICSWKTGVLSFIAERYGAAVVGKPETVVTKEFWDEIKNRVLNYEVDISRARNRLSAVSNAERLIKFYRVVSRRAV